jgi:proteasome lid subunit RPN8/RPN11
MSFSIHRIIRALFAPRATISCPHPLWNELIDDLNKRSQGVRESGAFLLGKIDSTNFRSIHSYVLYDDLDPEALDTGAIHIRSEYFSKLWDICKQQNLIVVADVHTHPGSSVAQSGVDKNNPMIAKIGHVSIILPKFGYTPKEPRVAGIYGYLGSKQWKTLQRPLSVDKSLYVGRWWL